MEVYILDELLRRDTVVDDFQSAIWTDRFDSVGDFEIEIHSTRDYRNLFSIDRRLAINLSNRVMVVRDVEDGKDSEGRDVLKVTGTSLEDVLNDRTARPNLLPLENLELNTVTMTIASPGLFTHNAHGLVTGDTVRFTTTGELPTNVTENTIYYVIRTTANQFRIAKTIEQAILDDAIITKGTQSGTHKLWRVLSSKWRLEGKPADIARSIFQYICIDGILDPADILPEIVPGSLYPPNTIPEPDTDVIIEIEPTTVYDAIASICKTNNLGFRITRDPVDAKLHFNIYSGDDRTTQQTVKAPVVFSPELDNLSDTREFSSSNGSKNVAMVLAPYGWELVYAPGTSPEVSGFNRRVLTVVAEDIKHPPGEALAVALQQRGQEELAQYRNLSAFDGEIPSETGYVYDVDYSLGDLIEMRNIDGLTNYMRVTEQIFTSDSNGERSYPTLATEKFITPGSWLAWESNQVWLDADGVWADQ